MLFSRYLAPFLGEGKKGGGTYDEEPLVCGGGVLRCDNVGVGQVADIDVRLSGAEFEPEAISD